MKTKIIAILSVFCLASILFSGMAFGETTVMLFDKYGGTFSDVKVGANLNLDVAASTANALYWGGWGTTQYNSAQAILNNINTYWPGGTQNSSQLLTWWFNGLPGKAGGNYWPAYNVANFAGPAESYDMYGVATTIDAGRVPIITLRQAPYYISLTGWGYGYDNPAGFDPFALYYTTPYGWTTGLERNTFTSTSHYDVTAGDWGGGFDGYGITFVEGLAHNPNFLRAKITKSQPWLIVSRFLLGASKLDLSLPGDGGGSILLQIMGDDGDWSTLETYSYTGDTAILEIPLRTRQDYRLLFQDLDRDFDLVASSPVIPTPVPGSVYLLGTGLVGVLAAWRKRRQN